MPEFYRGVDVKSHGYVARICVIDQPALRRPYASLPFGGAAAGS
jgi:hypothetical protein